MQDKDLVERVNSLIQRLEDSNDPRFAKLSMAYLAGEQSPASTEVRGLKGALTVCYFIASQCGYDELLDEIFKEAPQTALQPRQNSLLEMVNSANWIEAPSQTIEGLHPVLYVTFRNNIGVPPAIIEGTTFTEKIPFNYPTFGQFGVPTNLTGSHIYEYPVDFLQLFIGHDLEPLKRDQLGHLLRKVFDPEISGDGNFSVSSLQPAHTPPYKSDYNVSYRQSPLIRVKLRRDCILMNTVETYNGRKLVKGGEGYLPQGYSDALTAFRHIALWLVKRTQKSTESKL